MDHVSNEVSELQQQIAEGNQLLALVARSEAASLKPSIKKQALDLGAALVDRTTEILILEGWHPSRTTAFTDAQKQQRQKEVDQMIEARKEAAAKRAKLLDDCQHKYAQELNDLQSNFMLVSHLD